MGGSPGLGGESGGVERREEGGRKSKVGHIQEERAHEETRKIGGMEVAIRSLFSWVGSKCTGGNFERCEKFESQ